MALIQSIVKASLLDVFTGSHDSVDDFAAALAEAIIDILTNQAEVASGQTVSVAAAIPVQVVPATGTGATTAPGPGSVTTNGAII